jgi:hypothetical protein
VNRCGIRFLLGDLDGVLDDSNKALALNPKMALAWGYRGLARTQR